MWTVEGGGRGENPGQREIEGVNIRNFCRFFKETRILDYSRFKPFLPYQATLV